MCEESAPKGVLDNLRQAPRRVPCDAALSCQGHTHHTHFGDFVCPLRERGCARNATQHSVFFWNHAAKLNCGMATRRVPESHCVVGHANATAGDILGGPGPTRDKRHAACGAKVAVNYGVQRVWIAEEAASRFSSSSTPPPGMPGRRRGRRSVRRRGSLRRRRATGRRIVGFVKGAAGSELARVMCFFSIVYLFADHRCADRECAAANEALGLHDAAFARGVRQRNLVPGRSCWGKKTAWTALTCRLRSRPGEESSL